MINKVAASLLFLTSFHSPAYTTQAYVLSSTEAAVICDMAGRIAWAIAVAKQTGISKEQLRARLRAPSQNDPGEAWMWMQTLRILDHVYSREFNMPADEFEDQVREVCIEGNS